MRFGFNFYNWDHDLHRTLDQNLDQLLTWTKETGWEGFETKAHTIQNHPERLKAACERIGIACAALGGFSDIQNMIDYAHKANVAFIRTSVPEETAQHWVTYAAERNVTLAVHPHTGKGGVGTGAVETREDLLCYLDKRPGVMACPDTGHLMMCGSDPIQTLYDLGERCGFIHLKDIEMDMAKQGIKGPSFCNLGEGDLDLPGVMQALHDIHFDGWVIVERDRRVDDYLDSAQKMREVLRGMGY
jgi:sugar phosphate isomerase/epimerase